MRSRKTNLAVVIASLTAGAMIGQQIGGKATRDALFLSNFDVTSVPTMVMAAAVVSITVILLASGAMARIGPARFVPVGLALSGALHLVEWLLALQAPGIAAVVVYLHTAVIGLVLISGFWGLVTERFDPRTAKRKMGRIAAGATLGGAAGGFLADRVGALLTITSMLPALALLHFIAAVLALAFVRATHSPELATPRHEPQSGDPRYGFQSLREVRYLRDLARLVVLTTIGTVLVAYIFQVEASSAYHGERLMRFFALFYTIVNVVTFLLQTTVSRPLLERLGLTSTVATHPAFMAAASVGAMFVPGLYSATFAFGSITVLGNSTYRSGYELHYSALNKRKKRATKTIIDVGFMRLGDALGAVVVKFVLLLGAATVRPTILGLAAVIGISSLFVVRRLRRGYIQTLEDSLMNRAVDLELDEVSDTTTRETLLKSMTSLKIDPALMEQMRSHVGETPPEGTAARVGGQPPADLRDPLLQKMSELRSGDPIRIRKLLEEESSLDPAATPLVIRLLAWDEVSEQAIRALTRIGPRITGQLADALLDPDEEFAIRRRVPRVLVGFSTERAARALFRGLDDRRFEVRFQCGRALARLQAGGLPMPLTRDEIYAVVLNEVRVDRRVWVGRRLLERLDDSRESVFVDEVLRDRANRSLEHVFTILSLTLPREPLKVAFRGLHTSDRTLRGTALEYLESVLPGHVRQALWPFLEGQKTPKAPDRSREQILKELLKSSDSIQINLDELRKQNPEAKD